MSKILAFANRQAEKAAKEKAQSQLPKTTTATEMPNVKQPAPQNEALTLLAQLLNVAEESAVIEAKQLIEKRIAKVTTNHVGETVVKSEKPEINDVDELNSVKAELENSAESVTDAATGIDQSAANVNNSAESVNAAASNVEDAASDLAYTANDITAATDELKEATAELKKPSAGQKSSSSKRTTARKARLKK